jgi:catechol 2,3-dioxygenase-like lactoylglutathione lyase family enzyme
MPQSLHHVAYITYDSEATADFYTRVMGMPLVNVVMDDHLPTTGDTTPYFHTFFRMGDGSTIAFFESPGLPPTPADPSPAFDNFKHIAMQVPTRADVDGWSEWLEANEVDVQLVDHEIIYSAYFHDPNGIRLEITTTLVESWNDQGEVAASTLDEWARARAKAREAGEGIDEALLEVIGRHAHQASIRGDVEPRTAGDHRADQD